MDKIYKGSGKEYSRNLRSELDDDYLEVLSSVF